MFPSSSHPQLSKISLLLFVLQAQAANVKSSGTISELQVYTTFGGGDVIFKLTSPASGCIGFAVLASSTGFKQTYAMLLAAAMNGKPINVQAFNDKKWNGSGSFYCVVDSVGPQ